MREVLTGCPVNKLYCKGVPTKVPQCRNKNEKNRKDLLVFLHLVSAERLSTSTGSQRRMEDRAQNKKTKKKKKKKGSKKCHLFGLGLIHRSRRVRSTDDEKGRDEFQLHFRLMLVRVLRFNTVELKSF